MFFILDVVYRGELGKDIWEIFLGLKFRGLGNLFFNR